MSFVLKLWKYCRANYDIDSRQRYGAKETGFACTITDKKRIS